MPTGYTAKLYEGEDQTFEDFALSCARAFGAAILLRDEDGSVVPTPENVVSDSSEEYHKNRIADARQRIAELEGMTSAEADQAAHVEWEQEVDRYLESRRKTLTLRRRYEGMLDQVRAWEPPTEEHVAFRDFMIAQLTSSIDHDCVTMERYSKAPEAQLGEQWRRKEMDKQHHSLEYHRKELEAERERNAGRSRWVKELYDSLEGRQT